MFKKIRKNKKAQSTAEYAIMLGLVIAAVVAMQVYIQRAIKGKLFDATQFLTTAGANFLRDDGKATSQYEPDYLSSDYTSTRDSRLEISQEVRDTEIGGVGQTGSTNSTRTGQQITTYNGADEIDI